ncbi:MAG: protein rep [archaeon]|nr:protein rep [archaeon]
MVKNLLLIQRGSVAFRQEPSNKDFPKSSEGALLLDLIGISEQLKKDEKFIKQAQKIRSCGKSYSTFMCNCKFIKVRKRCNYIICPVCGNIRTEKLYKKFADLVKSKKVAMSIYDTGLRFLSLTVKNVEDVIGGVDKLYSSFKKLRRRKYWKERVLGGIGAIDMKKGQDGLWNVHIHALIYSKYLDMKSHKKKGGNAKLVEEWKKCTGGDSILDIKRVRSKGGALRYILKYLAKGISDLSYEEKARFFKLTFGRRLLFTFGSKKDKIFYGVKIPKKKNLCRDCHSSFQYVSPLSPEGELSEKYFSEKKPHFDLDYWIG